MKRLVEVGDRAQRTLLPNMRLHHGGRGGTGGSGFWDYPRVNLKDPKLLEMSNKVKFEVGRNGWARKKIEP